MNDRKRIIHVDDDEEPRKHIRIILDNLEDVELVQTDSEIGFYELDSLYADLYLLDRNLPEKSKGYPNDTSWRSIASFIGNTFPESKVILITGNVPKEGDWRGYRNIGEVMSKPIKVAEFLEKVRTYLGEVA